MNPNNDMKGALRSKENLFLEAMEGANFTVDRYLFAC
jgi:hypothetical protein